MGRMLLSDWLPDQVTGYTTTVDTYIVDTVNVNIVKVINYERLNGIIVDECTNIRSGFYICKTEVFGKKLISVLLGGDKNRISNSIY